MLARQHESQKKQGKPIGRILLRHLKLPPNAMTAIPLGGLLPEPLDATYPHAPRAASTHAYLVLLQVEVAAFHPGLNRLVSVALFVTLPCMAVSHHPALWSPDLPHGLCARAAVWLASHSYITPHAPKKEPDMYSNSCYFVSGRGFASCPAANARPLPGPVAANVADGDNADKGYVSAVASQAMRIADDRCVNVARHDADLPKLDPGLAWPVHTLPRGLKP